MRMRAAAPEEFGQPLVVHELELELEQPRADDALARLITGRRVRGSSSGGVRGRHEVPHLVRRHLDGDVGALLSHRITLDQIDAGFDLVQAQDAIRSIIEFGEQRGRAVDSS